MSAYYCTVCGEAMTARELQEHDRYHTLESERDRLKAELTNQRAHCSEADFERYQIQKDRDRLKAELEEANKALVKEHYAANNYIHDRDAWKAKAEKLAEVLRLMVKHEEIEEWDQNPVATLRGLAKAALAEYEK